MKENKVYLNGGLSRHITFARTTPIPAPPPEVTWNWSSATDVSVEPGSRKSSYCKIASISVRPILPDPPIATSPGSHCASACPI